MKIFKFLQGLVGLGNLRFAEIKSCPSASPTPQSGDFMPKMTFYAHFMLQICPPEHTKSGTNFFINGFDPPPRFLNFLKKVVRTFIKRGRGGVKGHL